MSLVPKLSSTHLGILVVLAGCVSYGMYPAAARAVYADGGNAALIVLVGTWARAVALTLFSLWAGKRLFTNRAYFKESFVGGFFQTITMFCTLSALTYLPGPIVIIIIFTHTLMLLVFMAWRGEIVLNASTFITTITALGGLSLVIDLWHKQSTLNLIGIGLAFLTAVVTVGRFYVYGHQTKARYPAVVGAENFLIAAVLVSLCCMVDPPHLPAGTGFVWLRVTSSALVVGSFCMFFGISLLGSFKYSLFAKMEPIFTALFSVWFLGEFLKPQQYLGIVVVVASLAIYQGVEHKRQLRADTV
jgi:drug/metabolite transporter (DMT)-like permease